MKKVTIIVLTCCTLLFAALVYILWWPVPSCSEYDFETAMHVSSDLLDIRFKQVMKYPYPVFEKRLDVPGVLGARLRFRYKFFPSTRMKIGMGPVDPKLCVYDLESTNSQVRVSAILSKEMVVCAKAISYGDEQLGNTVCGIMKKWVPTKDIPTTTETSKTPLWDKEKK